MNSHDPPSYVFAYGPFLVELIEVDAYNWCWLAFYQGAPKYTDQGYPSPMLAEHKAKLALDEIAYE